ncbi:hypothetical protein RND71_042263 [Anisodus tanguticus]|uniref:Uncharacterized protein n=1 Tax=Anisodus tanguticus TaxID=243964 RepID=A0AAE1QQB2_9SOLA|nr:hypothetical protein RND71_042263 [Anisodus tanguticus]
MASLILRKNEIPSIIPIIIDIIHHVPHTILNSYQDYHGVANEDEVGLIEQVTTNLLTLEETRVFVPVFPASRNAIESPEKNEWYMVFIVTLNKAHSCDKRVKPTNFELLLNYPTLLSSIFLAITDNKTFCGPTLGPFVGHPLVLLWSKPLV